MKRALHNESPYPCLRLTANPKAVGSRDFVQYVAQGSARVVCGLEKKDPSHEEIGSTKSQRVLADVQTR
jgi:hypothetical protein